MSKYYIIDTTLGSQPILFDSLPKLVAHLEGTVQRKFKQTRKQYMQNLVDLGYGYDDSSGRVFTQSLREVFNIGIVNGNTFKPCNVHDVDLYGKYKNEMGQ